MPISAFDDHTNPPDPRTPTGYAPGPSGSAWAERGEPDDDPGYTPRRQARRHAAPDTGTDLARYGLSAPDLDDQGGYQPQDDYYAEPHAEAEGDALNGGFVSAADDFDSSGGFFAGQPDFRGYADEDPAPPPPTVYGRARDKEPDQYGPDQYGPDHYDPEQYGPDPMAEPDGWTPRSRW